MEEPQEWGVGLAAYADHEERLTREEVERRLDDIVAGIEAGPGAEGEAAWIAAAATALESANVARGNGCAGDWDRIADAFAGEYAKGGAHCRRAVEAIVADDDAYRALWELNDRISTAMPHGAARAQLMLSTEVWNVETPAETVEEMAASAAAALEEGDIGESATRRLIGQATMGACAGAGNPGALIEALERVGDDTARARAGAWLLAVACTDAGWAQAATASPLDPEVVGDGTEAPKWLAKTRTERVFRRAIFDAARRWSPAIGALEEGWSEARCALAQGVEGAEVGACMVLAGLALGEPETARAVAREAEARRRS